MKKALVCLIVLLIGCSLFAEVKVYTYKDAISIMVFNEDNSTSFNLFSGKVGIDYWYANISCIVDGKLVMFAEKPRILTDTVSSILNFFNTDRHCLFSIDVSDAKKIASEIIGGMIEISFRGRGEESSVIYDTKLIYTDLSSKDIATIQYYFDL